MLSGRVVETRSVACKSPLQEMLHRCHKPRGSQADEHSINEKGAMQYMKQDCWKTQPDYRSAQRVATAGASRPISGVYLRSHSRVDGLVEGSHGASGRSSVWVHKGRSFMGCRGEFGFDFLGCLWG